MNRLGKDSGKLFIWEYPNVYTEPTSTDYCEINNTLEIRPNNESETLCILFSL